MSFEIVPNLKCLNSRCCRRVPFLPSSVCRIQHTRRTLLNMRRFVLNNLGARRLRVLKLCCLCRTKKTYGRLYKYERNIVRNQLPSSDPLFTNSPLLGPGGIQEQHKVKPRRTVFSLKLSGTVCRVNNCHYRVRVLSSVI